MFTGDPRSKFMVVLELVVKPPRVNVPIEPTPPGATVCGPEPAATVPAIEPTVPLDSVPEFNVTFPEPVAEPVVFVTRSVPPLTVVPPL
jgi:hypothetical protein